MTLSDRLWEALLNRCANDPSNAKRLVMVGRKEFDQAITPVIHELEDALLSCDVDVSNRGAPMVLPLIEAGFARFQASLANEK